MPKKGRLDGNAVIEAIRRKFRCTTERELARALGISGQTIKKVTHPLNRKIYKTSDEKFRQIRDREVPLSQLAAYFSAYEVSEPLISTMEAMLVRGFANDLLNSRMETFPARRRRKGSAPRRK